MRPFSLLPLLFVASTVLSGCVAGAGYETYSGPLVIGAPYDYDPYDAPYERSSVIVVEPAPRPAVVRRPGIRRGNRHLHHSSCPRHERAYIDRRGSVFCRR